MVAIFRSYGIEVTGFGEAPQMYPLVSRRLPMFILYAGWAATANWNVRWKPAEPIRSGFTWQRWDIQCVVTSNIVVD